MVHSGSSMLSLTSLQHHVHTTVNDTTVDHVAIRERIVIPTNPVKEMEEYERDRGYMEQCQKSFKNWYSRDRANGMDKVKCVVLSSG